MVRHIHVTLNAHVHTLA